MIEFGVDNFTKKPYIIGMNVINPILTILHTFQIVMGLAKGDLFKKYEALYTSIQLFLKTAPVIFFQIR